MYNKKRPSGIASGRDLLFQYTSQVVIGSPRRVSGAVKPPPGLDPGVSRESGLCSQQFSAGRPVMK